MGPTGEVPGPLAAKWDGYMKSLIEHENGHRDMAVMAAAELTGPWQTSPGAHLRGARPGSQVLVHERLKKLNEDAQSYDEITRHGIAQERSFPDRSSFDRIKAGHSLAGLFYFRKQAGSRSYATE